MTEQTKAQRLADILQYKIPSMECLEEAAAELRRLDQSEREGWRYADELEQERKRLTALNAELVEVLREIMSWEENEEMVWAEKANAALAKAKEQT